MKIVQLNFLLNKLKELHRNNISLQSSYLEPAEMLLAEGDYINSALYMQVIGFNQEITNMKHLGPGIEHEHNRFIKEAKELGMDYMNQQHQYTYKPRPPDHSNNGGYGYSKDFSGYRHR